MATDDPASESIHRHDLRKGFVVIGFSIINKIPADITNDFRSLLVAIDENDIKKSFVIYDKIVETIIDNTTPPSFKAFLFLVHDCLFASPSGTPVTLPPVVDDDIVNLSPESISKARSGNKKKIETKPTEWVPW